MKFPVLLLSLVAALTANAALAAPEAPTAPLQVSIPQQRAGDLIVHGSIAPAWVVPAATPPAAARPAPSAPTPPQALTAPEAVPAQPKRLGSADWRARIETLEAAIEVKKSELGQAKDSLVRAIEDEAREAQEQYQAAQRRAEEMKRQAERAAAAAQATRPAPPPPPAAPAPVAVAPAPAAPVPQEEIVFALRRSDRTIPAALTRWAEEARFNLLWEGKGEDRNPPVSFEDSYRVPFPDAVFKVVTSLNSAGSDLLMCEYTNRVVRVVPRAATCRINRNVQQNLAEGATN